MAEAMSIAACKPLLARPLKLLLMEAFYSLVSPEEGTFEGVF